MGWEGEGRSGRGGRAHLDICPGVPEFLVTPSGSQHDQWRN